MSDKGPIVTLLAFKTLNRDIAVLACDGVIRSTDCVDDPQYIVVPVVLHRDIFMYYSFAGEPLRLYRLKKDRITKHYKIRPSTGCRKFDISGLLLNWNKNIVMFGSQLLLRPRHRCLGR